MTPYLDKCMKTNSTKADILTYLDKLMKTHKISILLDIFMKNNGLDHDGGQPERCPGLSCPCGA